MNGANTYKLSGKQKVYRFLKAVMEFFIALAALSVLFLPFVIVAIAIKADSKGPVFFVQKRIGKNGRLFPCIKFRSMSVDAKHDIAGYEYGEVDAYVTKVGAFIRKYSIDELPQFINILLFQMSLIGYRPSQACETELNEARESYDMYQLRPGISGWAQVNGRDVLAAHPTKKAEYDAYYLQNFTLRLDIKIFFMTIVKVFKSDDVVEGVIEDAPAEEALAPMEDGAPISEEDGAPISEEDGAPISEEDGAPISEEDGAPITEELRVAMEELLVTAAAIEEEEALIEKELLAVVEECMAAEASAAQGVAPESEQTLPV